MLAIPTKRARAGVSGWQSSIHAVVARDPAAGRCIVVTV
jgi:hypothetical protein